MANVLHRITRQHLTSINTPYYQIGGKYYDNGNWIINPILPDCDKKFWVIEENLVKEMTIAEKATLAYQTESTIYLIAEKQLRTNQDGRDYESDTNAIINPEMPACELKYTKVVDNLVVEMTISEKKEVDKPSQIRERNVKVTEEIRLKYSEYDEMNMLRDYAFGDLSNTDQKMIDYKQVVTAAESKHPEIKAGKV